MDLTSFNFLSKCKHYMVDSSSHVLGIKETKNSGTYVLTYNIPIFLIEQTYETIFLEPL